LNEENNQQLQFPKLTIDDLYYVSLGPYQIRNTISYYAEHQKEETFLMRKFGANSRHQTAALDYTRCRISVENPLLVKAYHKNLDTVVENTITYSYSWIKLKQDEIQLHNTIVHVKVVLELSVVAITL